MQPGDAETAYQLVAQNDYGAYIWGSYGIAALALGGLLIWTIVRTRALERRAAAERRAPPANQEFQ